MLPAFVAIFAINDCLPAPAPPESAEFLPGTIPANFAAMPGAFSNKPFNMGMALSAN